MAKLPVAKDMEITKSLALGRAGYSLTLIEQCLVGYAIAMARETQTGISTDKPLTINAKAFSEMFRMKGHDNYGRLKRAVDKLFKREFSWNEKDAKGRDMTRRSRWLSEAGYTKGAGEVSFIFAPAVVDEITRVEAPFIRYQLFGLIHLRSGHAVRLFDLLMRFKHTGNYRVSVDELKFCFGVEDLKYTTATFNRNVLAPAIAQIHVNSPWGLNCEYIKRGKVITGYNFSYWIKPVAGAPVVDGDRAVEIPSYGAEWRKNNVPPRVGESHEAWDLRAFAAYKLNVLQIDPSQIDLWEDDMPQPRLAAEESVRAAKSHAKPTRRPEDAESVKALTASLAAATKINQ